MRTALEELQYCFRSLWRTPLFTAVSVLTFALAIGAATTVFSLVKGVLLDPLPYPGAGRLVLLWETSERMQSVLGYREIPVSPAMSLEWRRQARSFEAMGMFRTSQANLTVGTETERLRGAMVSASVFQVLGVAPLLGRTFSEEEENPGAGVILLSEQLWRTRFHSDPNISGRTIRLDDRPVTVLGVMPRGFIFPRGNEHPQSKTGLPESLFWHPLAIPAGQAHNFGNHYFGFVARLRDNASLTQAQSELSAIESRVLADFDKTAAKEYGVSVVPYLENMVKASRPALLMLSVAVGFVLLVATVNLAGLLLVRLFARRKEMAVRAALGAEPARLARHVLAESLLLAAMGCFVGVFFAVWGVSLLRGAAGANFPRLDSVGVDTGVLLFSLGVSLAAALLFGLVPALRLPRIDLAEALKGGGRSASARGHHRLRTTLVAIEVAASMVLLVGAGLLARSMWQILGTERGFEINNVLTLRLPLASYRYPQAEQREAFVRQVVDNISSLPQVECAGLVQQPPLTGDADIHTISIEGQPSKSGEEPIAEIRYITPGYFQAIRLPLRRGRFLDNGDRKDKPPVAVVNETLARLFWPGEDPLGKRFRLGRRTTIPWISVVGVIADARQAGLDQNPRPQVLVPFDQDTFSTMAVVVRARTDPELVASAVRQEIRKLDPGQPVLGMKTLRGLLDESIAGRRLHAVALGAFAVFALLLAAVGLHGVIAYSAAQRSREFAIRIALGADRRTILWMILSEGLRLGLIGLVAGAVCAAALGRLLEGLLYGVRPADTLTFTAVAALLLLCCLAASLVPARKAMAVDPIVTLNEA